MLVMVQKLQHRLSTYRWSASAGPVGKELLKAAATMGLEAFLGGSEHAAAKDAAEQASHCRGLQSIDITSVRSSSLHHCIVSL